MKKSIFGYNTQEADELIDSLQSQNDILTQKVAKLTLQLTNVRTAENNQDSVKYEALEAKNRELEENVQNLEQRLREETDNSPSTEELEQIRKENTALKEEIDRLSQIPQKPHDGEVTPEMQTKIGNLFRVAYSNCENMQNEIVGDMRGRITSYQTVIDEYNRKMREALQDTRERYQELMGGFASGLDGIFETLSIIDEGSRKIDETLETPQEVAAALRDRVEKLISENVSRNRQFAEMIPNEDQENTGGESDRENAAASPIVKLREKYFEDFKKDSNLAK